MPGAWQVRLAPVGLIQHEQTIMGWLMGLEPTTTGITIRDSTN